LRVSCPIIELGVATLRAKASANGPAKMAGRHVRGAKRTASIPDTIRRSDAGKYVAWAPDGLRIVAVASSFDAAERKAARAGYPTVAVARIPKGRTIDELSQVRQEVGMAKAPRRLTAKAAMPAGCRKAKPSKMAAIVTIGDRAAVERTKGSKRPTASSGESYPVSYAGKWIAWTPDGRRVVASATTLPQVRARAMRAGYAQVILERVPRNLEPVLAAPDS
jgi:hypothetical protein